MSSVVTEGDPGCCDTYCTSLQIWYLRVMRPGDTVQFNQNPKILPLGIAQTGCGVILIILDLLALFCQHRDLTAPPPSFLGSPGIPVWMTLFIVLSGCCAIAGYKRKERFMSAISFACSVLAVLFSISLLAVITMAIAQEVDFYDEKNKAMGIVIGTIMSLFVLAELVITSSTALFEYMALTSHDDRWFTDRGTQHFYEDAVSSGPLPANMSVPSGQPAFMFYAPQNDAVKFSNAFQDVLCNVATGSADRATSPMVRP